VIVISNRFESFNSESWKYQGETTSAESCPGKSDIMSCSRRQSEQSGRLHDEGYDGNSKAVPTINGACEEQTSNDEAAAEQNQRKRRVSPVTTRIVEE